MTIAGRHVAIEARSEPRVPVLYRMRLIGSDGVERPAMLVDFSPGGFMARCEEEHAIGDIIVIVLPRLGRIAAEVRWSLGGRIGCRLHQPIGLSDYHALLQVMPPG
ncbi:PilZ domain-containing protein [Sphingomonas sp.]|jgi:hypothetical protein|uniref:PilZ domain-containing protein n=1 Tax=Sphingomonas sp. TaxID=28214 RepID=UPI002ED89ADB